MACYKVCIVLLQYCIIYYSQYLLEEKGRVWSLVPEVFCPLVCSHARKVDQSMTPGLTHITWSSLNVDSFLHRVEESITLFERFTKEVR